MILVGGLDRPVIDAIATALAASNQELAVLEPAELEPGALFPRLLRGGARLILVDAVARDGEPEPFADIEPIIRAASAAGARQLVLVTSRPVTDPALVLLRRSGAPYHILRVGRLLDIATEAAAHLLTSPRIIVPRPLLAETRNAVLASDVAAAVAAALAEPSSGTSREVAGASGDSGVLRLLEQLGARAAVGGARTALWRLLGTRQLRLGRGGLLELEGRRDRASPLEKLEAVAGG